MKTKVLLLAILLVQGLAYAQTDQGCEQSSEEVRRLFSQMTQAWRSGDGAAWAAAFVPDADFTVWFGLQLHGQKAIAEGHQFIFDTFYANTSYELRVENIQFLSPTVAVVHLTGSVVAPGEDLPGEPDSVPLAVVQKVSGEWKVVAFQNTPFAVKQLQSQLGGHGDLRILKGRLAIPVDQR